MRFTSLVLVLAFAGCRAAQQHGVTIGEVYAFSPDVFAVRRDQPTQIIFWNLQADDEHDLMLTDPANHVLLETRFAPLSKTTYVMTFHDAGIFPFYCKMHQPAMSGQIIVTSQ
jgi:plastocyanin